jgi:hypothetical protein
MAALFPPWANTATHVVLLVLVVGGVAAVAAPMIYARTPFATGAGDPVVQPIQFDHRHHVRDDGIDCLYCHDGAVRGPLAGVPAADRCMGCHAQIWNDAPVLAPLRDSVATGAPIRWQRVHALPDFVYFEHAVHTRRGVGCVTCHGRVDEMAAVVQVAPLTMAWCLDCHRDPAPHLRPQAAITSTTWAPGPDQADVVAAYAPRRLTHCSACHR